LKGNFKPIQVLMVEDNPDDVDLIREAFKEAKVHCNLHVVEDGLEAMVFLRQRGKFSQAGRPDIVLLDLNLPRKDGCEVLEEIKTDENLRDIPVVVLTSSSIQEDIWKAYHLHVNCYITKPVDFEQFVKVVKAIDDFWFTVVKLPRQV